MRFYRPIRTLFCLLALLLVCFPSLAQIRVACLGDSIMLGRRDRISIPTWLQTLLGSDFNVQNFGRDAATVLHNGDLPFTHTTQYQDSIAFQPDIVLIMLGTNDTKPQNWQYSASFVTDYCALVETYRALPSAPLVYILRPLPAYANSFHIDGGILATQELPMFDQIDAKENAPVIDLYTLFLPYTSDYLDGVHPNDAGTYLIAQRIRNALENLWAIPTPSSRQNTVHPPHQH